MKVAVIKYNAGNIGSIRNALGRLGIEAVVTDVEDQIRSADRVIFPGVGEASSAMASLAAKGLDKVVTGLKQPVLGICLGLQLLCESSEENATKCLGVFEARVKAFDAPGIRVPHTGWNTVKDLRGGLFEGVAEGSYLYFVHGYFAEESQEATAVCNHGGEFSAALHKGNFHATQFHPEKSGAVGERILQNFIEKGEQI